MAGPVFHYRAENRSPRQLPAAFDGAVFLFEWERGWIQAVWLDDSGKVQSLRRVMPEQRFRRPISLQLGPDGALYLLEWGSNWSNNQDAALVRIGSQP